MPFAQGLSQRSLRRKLISIAMLTTCLTLIASNIAFIALEYYLSRQEIDIKLTVLSKVVTNQASTAIIFNDFSMLQSNLNTLSADTSIIRGCVFTPKQQLVASYRSLNGVDCPQFLHEIAPASPLNFTRIFPITLNNKLDGSLYLEASHEGLVNHIKQFLIFSVIILIVAALVALLLSNSLQGVVLRPLKQLGNTLRHIMRQKDYSIRAQKQSNDELGDLVDLFNALLSTVESENTSLRDSEERFRKLTALSPVGIFQIGPELKLEYVNQRWRDMHGINTQQPSLNDWFNSINSNDLVMLQPHWTALTTQQTSLNQEIRIQHKDGTTTWAQLLISAVHGQQGDLLGYLGTISNITELKDAQLQMETLAFYDSLTGLANRRLFRDRLEKAIAAAQRSGSSVALMFLDMDQFKRINDTLGHDAGDELLKTVALRLCSCVRETDTVSRIGGDEFTILLTDVHHNADIAIIADKLLRSLAEPMHINNQDITTSVSIGITLTPEDSIDANTLMKNADMAMYRAKEQGRNNYQFFSEEMNRSVLEHIELEQEITEALKNDQFVLTYQPKINLFDFSLAGLEVLIRWQHPEKGIIPPDRFIPTAEESGQILDIGCWVLEHSCEQMSQLLQQKVLPPNIKIAINLSARQFNDTNLVECVKNVLETTKLPAKNFELELTESTLMADADYAIKVMHELKELGVSIAIDDFGTGYSSLSYIKRFPIDVLKVDRSFVMDIPQDKNDMAITAAVIAMAHKLNLVVVAEGVETVEQLNFLHSNNCDEGQGYLFSRPLYLHQLKQFLANYKPENIIKS